MDFEQYEEVQPVGLHLYKGRILSVIPKQVHPQPISVYNTLRLSEIDYCIRQSKQWLCCFYSSS